MRQSKEDIERRHKFVFPKTLKSSLKRKENILLLKLLFNHMKTNCLKIFIKSKLTLIMFVRVIKLPGSPVR
jgi:uncharacterized protein (DUF488 family)